MYLEGGKETTIYYVYCPHFLPQRLVKSRTLNEVKEIGRRR
jgi:hypothetical protein